MMKFEWPLMAPDNHDVGRLSAATKDICEYVVDLSKTYGLTPGLQSVEGGATVHHACHARAQNMGAKSAEMLRLVPGLKVDVVERCSGHGGTFGVMKGTHQVANKVGRPAAKRDSDILLVEVEHGHDVERHPQVARLAAPPPQKLWKCRGPTGDSGRFVKASPRP